MDGGTVHPRGDDGKADFTRVVDCKCVAAKREAVRQERYFKLCELPEGSEDRTLENFKTMDIESLEEMMQAAINMIDGKLIFLTLVSDVDRGKTHLAIGICRKWLEMKKTAKYVFVPLLLNDLKAGFNQRGEDSYQYKLEFYLNVQLLVLDDFGVEHHNFNDEGSDWAMEQLETIVDYRHIHKLPTIITTNKTMDEINRLSPRIRSRMNRGGSLVIGIVSDEYIKLKKKAGNV
jgi:DNA replication protein DnaC